MRNCAQTAFRVGYSTCINISPCLFNYTPSWRVKARGESGECTTREANKGSRTVGQRRFHGFSSAVCIFPFFSFCTMENAIYHVIFHCGKNIKANAALSAGCVAAAAMTQCTCAPVIVPCRLSRYNTFILIYVPSTN